MGVGQCIAERIILPLDENSTRDEGFIAGQRLGSPLYERVPEVSRSFPVAVEKDPTAFHATLGDERASTLHIQLPPVG